MLKINNIITVKPNTEDPDFGGDIGGWQGRIIEIDTGDPENVLILIKWDADTLKNMPVAYLKKCFQEGYDHERMTLSVSDVILSEQADNAKGDRESVLEMLNREYAWEDLGGQGLRINAVEDACENDYALMDHWFEHLENHVTLSVKARCIGNGSGHLQHGAVIEINGFADTDDGYGVIGSVKYEKRWIQVPLCDVAILDIIPETQALDDYIVWFANK